MRTKVVNIGKEPITINLDDISFKEFCYLMVDRGYMTVEQAEYLRDSKC